MITCKKFKSFEKGSLRGFCDFYIDSWGIEIRGCKMYMKDGKRWVNLPQTEYEDNGEKKYSNIVAFPSKEIYRKFTEAALASIDKFCAENAQSTNEPATGY